MPPIDDELERRLRHAQRHVETDRVVPSVMRRRKRRSLVTRAGNAGLAAMVLAGTALGYGVLDRAFEGVPVADGGGGVIAFRRLLRPCDEAPHVGGGLDIFAVTPDGSTEWRFNADAMHDRRRFMFESQPSFAPDGQRFAWIDHYAGGLWVTDVVTNTTTKLDAGPATRPTWLPDGSAIVYTNSLDPEASGPGGPESWGVFSISPDGGERRLLAEMAELPVVSPDGRTIAFLRRERDDGNGDVRRSLWFMDADGGDQREMRTQPEDARFSVRDADWSPDGLRFVVEALVDGNIDLYVVNLDAETGYRLTDHPAADTSPSWSPDGQLIAFETGRWGEGVGHAEIAVVPASGGEPTRLTDDCWDDVEPEWVPNDSAIRRLTPWVVPPLPDLGPRGEAGPEHVLFSADVQGVSDIYALDPGGGMAVNLTSDVPTQLAPAWSPDHRWIAFALSGDEERADGVYLMRPDGSDLRLVAEAASRPAWSPDGSTIAVEVENGIDLVGVETGTRRSLTVGDDHQPTWSPDGGSLVVSRWGDVAPGLYIVDVGSGDAARLTSAMVDQAADWSPDGTTILFQRMNHVAQVLVAGGDVTILRRGGGDVHRSPVWSPNGSRILYVSSERPDRGAERGGQWLWTMRADGSGARPIEGSPATVAAEPDW